MKTAPTNARELLDFLMVRPMVESRCDDPRIATGPRRYRSNSGGGLWFTDPAGNEEYVPIDCGMTRHETGLAFRPDGFDVTKFGVTIHFDYLD